MLTGLADTADNESLRWFVTRRHSSEWARWLRLAGRAYAGRACAPPVASSATDRCQVRRVSALAPSGDVIIGKEPSGEFVGRTEETLDAETEEPLIVPVTGNDAFTQEGEGQTYGHVLQLGRAAREVEEIHHDLLFPAA